MRGLKRLFRSRNGMGKIWTRFTTFWSMAQVVVLVLTILPVERSLKKHFDENGNPKE